jgi:hypothetical protein
MYPTTLLPLSVGRRGNSLIGRLVRQQAVILCWVTDLCCAHARGHLTEGRISVLDGQPHSVVQWTDTCSLTCSPVVHGRGQCTGHWYSRPSVAPSVPPVQTDKQPGIALLRDIWFGPVTGQVGAHHLESLPRTASTTPTLRVPRTQVHWRGGHLSGCPQLFSLMAAVGRSMPPPAIAGHHE